jgi:predicted  nucleic acid-binding Zn-ribbon protein
VRLQQLLELSRLDTQLAGLEEDRAALPARRSAAVAQQAAAEGRLEGAREEVARAAEVQRKSEVAAQDQEALLKKLQGQQFQVKTNDAYTALLHEMERAQAAISECETRILEAMESIAGASARQRELEAELRGVRAHVESEQRSCDEREKDLSEQIGKLREQRDAAAGRLEARTLSRYEKILSRRRPAVTLVVAQTCQGCRVGIPPQLVIEIRRGEDAIACPNCTRILVLEDQLRQMGEARS